MFCVEIFRFSNFSYSHSPGGFAFHSMYKYNLNFSRVPTQVLQSLLKSYIRFSICKALQSLIFWVFSSKRSYQVLFLKEIKENWKCGFHLGVILPKSLTNNNLFC